MKDCSGSRDPLRVYEIGDACQDGDTYCIKPGNGLIGEPSGDGVLELDAPGAMPFVGGIAGLAARLAGKRRFAGYFQVEFIPLPAETSLYYSVSPWFIIFLNLDIR